MAGQVTQPLGTNILLEAGTNELEVLVFYLDNHRYGVNGAKVREVVHPPPVRPVPSSHPVLDGLCRLRDAVIPMISLRKYLKLPVPEKNEGLDSSQVIVTVFNEQAIAIRVDRVDRIYRVSWKQMRPIPRLLDGGQNQFTGLTVIEEDIVLMVDMEKIAEEISERQASQQLARQIPPGKPLTGRKLVYAEDSQMIQAMAVNVLKAAGVSELHVFNNGEEAWQWLDANQAKTPVDGLVTDLEMPLMDGLHLTSRIRNDPRMKTLPVILLSSLVNPENEKKGKSVGVTAQLVKAKMAALPRVLEDALKG